MRRMLFYADVKRSGKVTKQSLILSDTKLGIGVKISLGLSDRSLCLPTIIPRALLTSEDTQMTVLRPIPWKQSPKDTEKQTEEGGGGGEKNGTWLDSMRAASPPRATAVLETQEHKSWMLQHPSALSMFDQIMGASKGKKIVMFMDYDGTLSPIVEDPDRAFMSHEMREAVRDTAKYFPTAIVSGRCRDKVYNFVKLAGLYYAGSHGMDIKGPPTSHRNHKDDKSLHFQPASEFIPMIDEVYKSLLESTKTIVGAKVETNKFCLSVHFRCVNEKEWDDLAEKVRLVLVNYPKLKLTLGRKVLEIRPTIKWDKGKALEFLLKSLGFAPSDDDVFPIYLGDDRTDEDAFRILKNRGQGIGILVSKVPKETNAAYSLRDPSEVMSFLKLLVGWKKQSRTKHDAHGAK
ncbi:hypothetical protein MLD38_001456 [Melastoma candidum]|uniref:Uncharacterized protein n=1 Tax=Melastoma candidum TaxID=119954 RepID=A0ACB9SEL0_9MYRT|nr:hypothetical protein MLD38_001456 [Melastoma candidum]